MRAAVEQRVGLGQEPRDRWGSLLGIASWIYWGAVELRNRWYDKGMGVRKLPAPVLSVGNLSVGGTGKTPLVMMLARKFREKGLEVAVLSRGYGRVRGVGVVEVSRGQGSRVPVSVAGDEPYMMAQGLQGVRVWVGRDRFKAGMAAWRAARPDLFIMDDGFQHRSLHRDLDLVVARSLRPWGNGRLLPAGPLREPLASLQRAHLLVLTGTWDREDATPPRLEGVRVPVLRASLSPKTLRLMNSEQVYPLQILRGKRAGLVCAIGQPDGFRQMVRGLGAEVGPCLFFPDHHWYTPQDVALIQAMAREVELVLTTGKDIWKLMEAGPELPRLMVLEVGFEPEREDVLEAVLRRLPL